MTLKAVAGGGSAGITSVGTNFTVTNGVLNSSYPAPRNVAGTTDTITSADAGSEVVYNNTSAVAVTIAAATSAGLTQGFAVFISNRGAGKVTITPTTSTINSTAILVIPQNSGALIYSDGTNYQIDLTGSSNLVFFYPNNDSSSVKLGNAALANQTTSSGQNVAIGSGAGGSLITGNQVVFLGEEAGRVCNTGGNIAIGFQAMFSAAGANNVVIGFTAARNMTGATTNVIIGQSAGNALSSGSNNIIIGQNVASTVLATGNNNILIGASSGTTTPATNTSGYMSINNSIIVDMNAPTIGSGFGTSPSVVNGGSTAAFTINVGTGGTATSGVINFTNAAPNGWAADVTNLTHASTLVAVITANTTTSITIGSFSRTTGLSTAFTASDILLVKALAY